MSIPETLIEQFINFYIEYHMEIISERSSKGYDTFLKNGFDTLFVTQECSNQIYVITPKMIHDKENVMSILSIIFSVSVKSYINNLPISYIIDLYSEDTDGIDDKLLKFLENDIKLEFCQEEHAQYLKDSFKLDNRNAKKYVYIEIENKIKG